VHHDAKLNTLSLSQATDVLHICASFIIAKKRVKLFSPIYSTNLSVLVSLSQNKPPQVETNPSVCDFCDHNQPIISYNFVRGNLWFDVT